MADQQNNHGTSATPTTQPTLESAVPDFVDELDGAENKTPFDQFAKALWEQSLQPAGALHTEFETTSAAMRVDAVFVPDPARAQALGALGLLGQLAQQCCLLEACHNPPTIHDVFNCLEKQLAVRKATRSSVDRVRIDRDSQAY